MTQDAHADHPIRAFFAQSLRDAMSRHVGPMEPDVEAYLTRMLGAFLHLDRIYAVRDAHGQRVTSVAEMVEEGDVRLKATSFDREREVHRHIGDFLLFWSGLFPEHLRHLKSPAGRDALLDPVGQGKMSYHVASTFEHEPYGEESRTLRKLSEEFEGYQFALGLVRASFDGLGRQGWRDGFRA